jgi:suppressor for copper-sensitivity B
LALNRKGTAKLVEELGVVPLKADKTREAPEVEALLRELGNASGGIPFYAIFPGNGGAPITFGDGLITQGQVLERLQEAGPSKKLPAETSVAQSRE